jgi:hypothetical protein
MSDVKYPKIHVQLTGLDNNAGSLMGAVTRALKRAGVPAEEITAFRLEATSGTYDELIQTCIRWVEVT